MTDIALRVENLSKRYRIGGRQERYKTLRDTIMDTAAAPLRRLRRLGQPTPSEETIWALKDVSFEVKHGEVLGIIGRNGAGKTTLLKILCRITEPTEGCAEIHGRVGSLLEVGTGFHPELTGRENIYLSGAILGMKRSEIDKKFDEIVQFAEIERFLDTPAKRYSSGMYVRLAFAVAAHLEPEILLVDEVLAVGDVGFQKKCLGKMGKASHEGRTVLFVSHNMNAVRTLCEAAILLDGGKIVRTGRTLDVTKEYEAAWTMPPQTSWSVRQPEHGKELWIARVELRDDGGKLRSRFKYGDKMRITVTTRGVLQEKRYSLDIHISSRSQGLVMYTGSDRSNIYFDGPASVLECELGPLCLMPGLYIIRPSLRIPGLPVFDAWEEALAFEVTPSDVLGTGVEYSSGCGTVFMPHRWRQLPAGLSNSADGRYDNRLYHDSDQQQP